jgi:regulator of replication initiation timing
MPMGVEESIGASLRHNRAFAALGLDSIMKAQRATERHMDRLESENTELRKENAKLRNKLVEHWETMEKLNTHELETKQETEKIERMGRMGERSPTR